MAIKLQVGKMYEVLEPDTCAALGIAHVVNPGVTIIRENEGLFLGDNDIWYNSDGTDQLGNFGYARIIKEL